MADPPPVPLLPPLRFELRALALALAIGAAGGAIFAWFRLPLAWMLGAMLATTAAAMAGSRVAVPPGLRSVMVMVLGVMLGSAFTPAILEQLDRWLVSLSGLVAYIVVSLAVGLAYLQGLCRYDRTTAFFTAAPGGFSEMVLTGGALGGDERTIALSHSVRIMLVVLIVPFWFQLLVGFDPATRGPLGPALADIAWRDALLLAACLVGAPLATLLRLPAAALIGPMLLSVALHLAGLTATRPPGVLVAAAQVVVGAAIGCRFAGVSLRRFLGSVLVGLGLAALLLGLTLAFAWLLHALTDLPVRNLILAYAPGGLAEMSLIALALDADPAFVAIHHIVRIALIILLAPLSFVALRRLAARPGA